MSSIEDILAQVEDPSSKRTASARILLRQDLARRHAALVKDLDAAMADDKRLNRTPLAPRLAGEVQALEAEIDAAQTEFTFQSVGKRRWADLLAKHPPTKEQRKLDQRIDHDPEKFPVSAIAASCIDPKMSVEDVKRLEAELNQTQFDALWVACLDANLGGGDVPKSLAAGVILHAKELFETTAALGASPDPSSLAG